MATKRVSESKVVVSGGPAGVPARRKAAASKRVARTAPVEVISNEAVAVEPVTEVTSDAVAKLAYSYWEARGYQGGCPQEDWLRAEQELRAVPSK